MNRAPAHPREPAEATRVRRAPARLPLWLLVLATGCMTGCMTGGPNRSERPFVVTQPPQLRDLYWRGELTDSRGNRWRIWIVPGVAPPVEDGADAVSDAADYAAQLSEGPFWERRAQEFSDGVRFAVEDSARDFLVEGIAEDYRLTTRRIAKNVEEAPFAWIPRVIANAVWGYGVRPAARIALAPLGIGGGLAYAALAPPAQVAARPVGAVAWTGLAGIAWPAARIALHQPVYLLSIANREPDVSHHGDFGMYVIEWADGEPPEGAPAVRKRPLPEATGGAKPQGVEPVWTEQDHRRAYESDPSYRRGYDYGVERGRAGRAPPER